jgi:hypothetical protein
MFNGLAAYDEKLATHARLQSQNQNPFMSQSSSSLAAAFPCRILSRVLFIRPKVVMLPEARTISIASIQPSSSTNPAIT